SASSRTPTRGRGSPTRATRPCWPTASPTASWPSSPTAAPSRGAEPARPPEAPRPRPGRRAAAGLRRSRRPPRAPGPAPPGGPGAAAPACRAPCCTVIAWADVSRGAGPRRRRRGVRRRRSRAGPDARARREGVPQGAPRGRRDPARGGRQGGRGGDRREGLVRRPDRVHHELRQPQRRAAARHVGRHALLRPDPAGHRERPYGGPLPPRRRGARPAHSRRRPRPAAPGRRGAGGAPVRQGLVGHTGGLGADAFLDDMRTLKQSGTLLVSDEAGSLVLLVARGQVEASFRLGAYGRLESPGQSYHLHLHEPAPTPQLPGRSPHSDSAVLRALPRTRTPMRIPTGVVDLPALLERLGALAFDGLLAYVADDELAVALLLDGSVRAAVHERGGRLSSRAEALRVLQKRCQEPGPGELEVERVERAILEPL